jgi:hypothetical protein
MVYFLLLFLFGKNVRDMNKSCFLGDDVSILVIGK